MKLWTFRSWPDEVINGHYAMPRGWWFRFGERGWGLSYKNVRMAGYKPLFSERHGYDRTVALRVGPHIFKVLRYHRLYAPSFDARVESDGLPWA